MSQETLHQNQNFTFNYRLRRLEELRQTLQIIRRTENQLDTNQILSVIEQYTSVLDLLDDYNHLSVKKPDGTSAT